MNAIRKISFATLLLAIAIAAVSAAAAPRIEVRRAFPPGDYLMTTNSRAEGLTETAGERQSSRDQSREVWRLAVGTPDAGDGDTDGGKQLRLRLIEARTAGQDGGQSYRYDSTRPDRQEGGLGFAYGPLMQTEVTVTLDADDTVVEVSGLDRLRDGLAAQAQTPLQKGLLAELRIAMGDKGLETNFRRLEALMPKNPVAVGDTWKAGVRVELPMVGELKVRYDCRLAAVEPGPDGDIAVIEAQSDYRLTRPKTIAMEGVEVRLTSIEMQEQATLRTNLRTGLLVSDTTTRTAAVQGTAGQGDQQQPVSSRTRTQTTSTLTGAGQGAPIRGSGTADPGPDGAATAVPDPGPMSLPPPSSGSNDSGAAAPGPGPGGRVLPSVAPGAPRPGAVTGGPTSAPTPPLVLRRQTEPRQQAFSVLVPDGWQTDGGLFSVDPNQSGGSLNAVDTKCDFSVKRDPAGTVMARWAPSYNFVDFSRAAEFANMAQLFPPGRVYNGALVKPMPSVEDYLMEGFRQVRPQATEVRIVERIALPALAELAGRLSQSVDQGLAQLGKPPIAWQAGALIIDYSENGTRYREAAVTALGDLRPAAGIWFNQFTFHMRAPAGEAETWKPTLDIVRQSLKFNPDWVAAYVRAAGDRGQAAAEVFRYLGRVDQEIFANRAAVQGRIDEENYLLLTGQERYVNPYTNEVEQDSADYRFRWTTAGGDRLYSNQYGFDPNRDEALRQFEWKLTPVQPR